MKFCLIHLKGTTYTQPLLQMSLFITSPPDFAKTSPPDFFELVPSARSLGRMNKIGTNAILLTQSGLKVGFKLHV